MSYIKARSVTTVRLARIMFTAFLSVAPNRRGIGRVEGPHILHRHIGDWRQTRDREIPYIGGSKASRFETPARALALDGDDIL